MPGLLSTSLRLLRRAQAGDRSALDDLFERHAPALRRWAHGRLPRWARHLADTGDVVQDALLSVFRRIDEFEPRRKQALQAYLHQAARNRIRDLLRKATHAPGDEPPDLDALPDPAHVSPLRAVLDSESEARYARAIATLDPAEQELVVGRFELGYTHEQLALSSGKPTAAAARMALRRALLKLARAMRDA